MRQGRLCTRGRKFRRINQPNAVPSAQELSFPFQNQMDNFTVFQQPDAILEQELQSRNEELQKQVQEYEQENEKLKGRIAGIETYIQEAHQATAKDMRVYLETIEEQEKDFEEAGEALDQAHQKIKEDIAEIRKLIKKNEAVEAENAELKEKERELRKQVKHLEEELQEQEEKREEKKTKEESNYLLFWKDSNGSKLNQSQRKIRELERSLKTLQREKFESYRKLATMDFALKQSKQHINDQKKLISRLESGTKLKNRRSDVINRHDDVTRSSDARFTPEKGKLDEETKNSTILELEAKLSEVSEQKVKLENHLEKLLVKMKEFYRTGSTGEEQEAALRELEEQNEELRRKLAEMEDVEKHVETLTEENEKLKEEAGEVENLQNNLDEVTAQNEKLRIQLAEEEEAKTRQVAEEQQAPEESLRTRSRPRPLPTIAEDQELELEHKVKDLEDSYTYKMEESLALRKELNELRMRVETLAKEKEELVKRLAEEKKKIEKQLRLQFLKDHRLEDLRAEKRQLELTLTNLKNASFDHVTVYGKIATQLSEMQEHLKSYVTPQNPGPEVPKPEVLNPEVGCAPQSTSTVGDSRPSGGYQTLMDLAVGVQGEGTNLDRPDSRVRGVTLDDLDTRIRICSPDAFAHPGPTDTKAAERLPGDRVHVVNTMSLALASRAEAEARAARTVEQQLQGLRLQLSQVNITARGGRRGKVGWRERAGPAEGWCRSQGAGRGGCGWGVARRDSRGCGEGHSSAW